MTFFSTVILLVLSINFYLFQVLSGAGVLELNKDNFRTTTAKNEYVLVEFYAPWCEHCQAFAPEYVRTADILQQKNSQVKVAKVDATEERSLAEENNIRKYPTIKFFKNGYPSDYNGQNQAEDIIEWLSKMTNNRK